MAQYWFLDTILFYFLFNVLNREIGWKQTEFNNRSLKKTSTILLEILNYKTEQLHEYYNRLWQ